MKKVILFIAALTLAATYVHCQPKQESMEELTERVLSVAKTQCTALSMAIGDKGYPKTYQGDTLKNTKIGDWVSGFFPGTCWYVYAMTGDEAMKKIALKETAKLKEIVAHPAQHDIGFQTMCSWGNQYKFTGDESCLPIIHSAADYLTSRFSPVTGTTKSWGEGPRTRRKDNTKHVWEWPVIIDNMMNLELLEFASKQFGDPRYDEIARTHANTTMKNHFRPDYTTWHVVDYVKATGDVHEKVTWQGDADNSAWARGQAWALYGFTMMYDQTGDERYLAQAENVAKMIFGYLPEDGVPYWDFNAPGIPNVKRDASAGCVMASAYITLSTLTKDSTLSEQCLATAEKILRTLASPKYLASPVTNGGYLLKHSVGHYHGGVEIDVPLTYADYYFVEALYKYSQLRWIDAYKLNIIGKPFPDTPNPYHRVDTIKYKGMTSGENNQLRCPTGMAVLFKTNSKKISLCTQWGYVYNTVSTMSIAYRGYNLYIKKDGKWIYAASGAGKNWKKGQPDQFDLISNMDGSMHECMLYLPMYSEIKSLKIGIDKGATITPLESPFRHTIAVYGSSYTQGVSTSRSGMTWPMQLERRTGFGVVSMATSGRCLMQPYITDILVDLKADAFIFDTFSNPDSTMIKERFMTFVDRMIDAHPGVPMIFQQTIYRENRNFDVAREKKEAAKMAAAREMYDSIKGNPRYKDVYFIVPSAVDGSHEYSVDGTHPDDYGYYMWTVSIEKKVKNILKKYGIK